jgi:hypothetical protein
MKSICWSRIAPIRRLGRIRITVVAASMPFGKKGGCNWRNLRLQPRSAFSPVHRADLEGLQRVDSGSRISMGRRPFPRLLAHARAAALELGAKDVSAIAEDFVNATGKGGRPLAIEATNSPLGFRDAVRQHRDEIELPSFFRKPDCVLDNRARLNRFVRGVGDDCRATRAGQIKRMAQLLRLGGVGGGRASGKRSTSACASTISGISGVGEKPSSAAASTASASASRSADW